MISIKYVPLRFFLLFYLILGAAQLTAAPPIFSDAVNEKFPHRQHLKGWTTTAEVIRLTLREWYGAVEQGPQLRNAPPNEWRNFLKAVPAGSSSQWSIVYCASHQTPAAEWEFSTKEQIQWGTLIQESGRKSGAPTLVIVDACFAASAWEVPVWRQFAPRSLFASDRLEREFEMRFDRSRPYDAPRRFPETREWLRARLGKSWDGRISFLGMMWVEAFRETPIAPRTPAELEQFLRRIEARAAWFRENESRRFASKILLKG